MRPREDRTSHDTIAHDLSDVVHSMTSLKDHDRADSSGHSIATTGYW